MKNDSFHKSISNSFNFSSYLDIVKDIICKKQKEEFEKNLLIQILTNIKY